MNFKYDYSRGITKKLLNSSFSVFPFNNFIQGIIDRTLCEGGVQVEHVVAAVVVVVCSAVAASL